MHGLLELKRLRQELRGQGSQNLQPLKGPLSIPELYP